MRVEDPENQDRLCDVLRKVVLDEQLRNSLSHHGSVLSRVLEAGLPDRPPIVGSLERLVAAGTVN